MVFILKLLRLQKNLQFRNIETIFLYNNTSPSANVVPAVYCPLISCGRVGFRNGLSERDRHRLQIFRIKKNPSNRISSLWQRRVGTLTIGIFTIIYQHDSPVCHQCRWSAFIQVTVKIIWSCLHNFFQKAGTDQPEGYQSYKFSDQARFTKCSPQYIQYLPFILASTGLLFTISVIMEADLLAVSRKRWLYALANAGPFFSQ